MKAQQINKKNNYYNIPGIMNIIINGGSRGIGRELALKMSDDKSNQLIITGRDAEALKQIAGACKNNNISCITLDLAEIEKNFKEIQDQIFSRFSKVDILINNAGMLIVEEFLKTSARDARMMMETNFFGPSGMIRIVVPLMSEGSHIVNISSMGGFQGSSKYKGLAYYSASKSALACLTECLAEELKEQGIRVNCLSLGSVQTEMFEKAFPGMKASLKPGEMAEFISWFATNGSRFFNGKILPVGMSNP